MMFAFLLGRNSFHVVSIAVFSVSFLRGGKVLFLGRRKFLLLGGVGSCRKNTGKN